MNHCLSSTSRDMRWKKLILVEVTAALTSDTERSQENRSKNDKYKAGLVWLGLFVLESVFLRNFEKFFKNPVTFRTDLRL